MQDKNVPVRIDKGVLLENLIYCTLTKKYQKDYLKFWRTADGNEVDFVLNDDSVKFALEVKFSHKEIKKSKYSKFNNAYPHIPLHFVFYHTDTNQTSVWKWL